MKFFWTFALFGLSLIIVNAQASQGDFFLRTDLNFQKSVSGWLTFDINNPSSNLPTVSTTYSLSTSLSKGYQINSSFSIGIGIDFEMSNTNTNGDRTVFDPITGGVSINTFKTVLKNTNYYFNIFGQYQKELFPNFYWIPRMSTGFLRFNAKDESQSGFGSVVMHRDIAQWHQNYIQLIVEQDFAYFIKDNIGLTITVNRFDIQSHLYDSRFNENNQQSGRISFNFSSKLRDFKVGAIFVFKRKAKETE